MAVRNSGILGVALLFAATAAHGSPIVFGDVDGNGRVEIADVQLSLRAALHISELPAAASKAADVAPLRSPDSFGDGRIDVRDVVRILRRAIGLEKDPWPARLSFFLLEPGNSWTYDNAKKGDTMTITVGDPIAIGGQGAYPVTLSSGETDYLRQDEQSQDPENPTVLRLLRRVETGGLDLTFVPPIDLLRYPAVVGKTWSGSVAVPIGFLTAKGNYTTTILAQETVSTPAGDFDTYKVKTDISASAFGISLDESAVYHYAPWFGWVDIATKDPDVPDLIAASANIHGTTYP